MTTSSPLRVGFIGANGRWGPRAHVPALQRLPETEIYAVCTAHADTAQAAADKFGVKRAYGDDRAMDAGGVGDDHVAPDQLRVHELVHCRRGGMDPAQFFGNNELLGPQ